MHERLTRRLDLLLYTTKLACTYMDLEEGSHRPFLLYLLPKYTILDLYPNNKPPNPKVLDYL
jgi:hypothetical protein